ncbi:MAG: thioredoxin domain-containing protein, partial [Rhodoglobus sp.]
MSTNAKIAVGFTALLFLVVGVVIAILALQPEPQLPLDADGTPSAPTVLRDNSHRLDVAEDGKVTLVEFLDFECEACGAYYPLVEQFREDYAGQVTFAFRYFPLPGHGNSVNAAVAVEAAAQQGQLEPMFHRMFQTQAEWGEKGIESQAPIFRSYADQLGLDMDQYDADVADPATLKRIELDFNEGIALGV